MLFSIITVVRDNLPGLRITHESVTAQSCLDYEWLVVDGMSEDGTFEFLAESTAANLSWRAEPDAGLFDAMNRGIGRASGDYIIFLNGGDAFASPDTLSMIKLALAGQALPPAFVYGDALEEWPGHPPVLKRARPYRQFFQGMITHHQAMLYSRDALGTLRFDITYQIAADFKFTAQFLQDADGVLYLDFPLCLFEAGGISQRQFILGRNEQFRARRELALCGDTQNIMIYARQSLVMMVRQLAPRLYWWLRHRAASPPAAGEAPISL